MASAYPAAHSAAYPAAWKVGSGPGQVFQPPADLWAKPTYPDYPKTTFQTNLTLATTTRTGTAATFTDVTDPFDGKPGVRITFTTTGAVGITLGTTPGAPTDITAGGIEIEYRTITVGTALRDSNTVITSILYPSGVTVGSVGSNNRSVAIQTAINQKSGVGQRSTIIIPAARHVNGGGGVNLNDVLFPRLTLNKTSGSNVVIEIYGWKYVPNPIWSSGKVPVFLRFDGAGGDSHRYARDQLRLNFGGQNKMFLSINAHWPDIDGTTLTWAEIADIVANGGEYAPHGGWDDDETRASIQGFYDQHAPERIEAKARGYDDMAASGTFYGGSSTSTGPSDQYYLPMIKTYNMYCDVRNYIAFNNDSVPLFLGGETMPFSDRYNIRWLSGNGTFTDPTTAIDNVFSQALTNRGSIGLVWHAELAAAGDGRTAFDRTVSNVLASSSDFELRTPKEFRDAWRLIYGGIA